MSDLSTLEETTATTGVCVLLMTSPGGVTPREKCLYGGVTVGDGYHHYLKLKSERIYYDVSTERFLSS